MQWQDYIHQDPKVMLGKPVFRGTRLTVAGILEDLGAGSSEQELLDAYPTLKPEHVRAACAYAAAVISLDETIFVDQPRGAA